MRVFVTTMVVPTLSAGKALSQVDGTEWQPLVDTLGGRFVLTGRFGRTAARSVHASLLQCREADTGAYRGT